jgi:hypothetical protein
MEDEREGLVHDVGRREDRTVFPVEAGRDDALGILVMLVTLVELAEPHSGVDEDAHAPSSAPP